MAKKLGKFLALAAVLGAAAGAFYYYKSKDSALNDFDDFDDDLNDDLEDFLKEENTSTDSKREYVPLNFSKETVDDAKETIQNAAKSVEDAVADAVKDVTDKASDSSSDSVVKPDSTASQNAEEFKFNDL